MRWQYKRLELDIADVNGPRLEAALSELGADGWELVTSVQQEKHGYSRRVHFLFKRREDQATREEAAE